MKIKMSIVAASLLASSALFADSTSLADALKASSANGEFAFYAEHADVKHSDDQGFGSGSFNVLFQTGEFYGVKFQAGSRANHAFWEADGDEYAGNEKAILHTANLAYSHPHLDVILGRQEINLNWASDFHEALVGVVKVIPDTTIIVGYTQRVAIANFDEPLTRFEKLGEDGAFVVDASWTGVEGLNINTFIYYANDVATWAGVKADFDKEISDFTLGATAQYTQSDEDNGDDGSFLGLEARGGFADVSAKLGFFKTDKDGGAGSIGAAGENVNPFEDGDQIFDIDARTLYIGAEYEFKGFTLSALYGHTKYDGGKFRELDIGAGYAFSDNFNLQAFLINGDDSSSGNYGDYTKVTFGAVYSF